MKINRNPDWETAAKRMEAFWQREMLDRPCIQIYVPVPEEEFPGMEALPPCDCEALWNDKEILFQRYRMEYMRTRYLGEAFPVLYPNWAGVPIMCGSHVTYGENTIWVKPAADSIREADMDQVRIDHPVVEQLLEKLSYCAEHAKGEAFIGMPPMGNAGDTLAQIWGYDNLCIGLIEEPETILAAEKKLTAFWKKLYDRVYGTLGRHTQGSCGWLSAWHPGRSALIEFDLAAMISPEMFRMYLPELLERADHAGRSIYHLDGPDSLIHLDTILAQKEFDAVQWEPGSACENILEWIPVMQKIQAAGKSLFVAGPRYSPEAVLELLKNLRPEGLMIPMVMSGVEEGERFLEKVEKMY